MPSDDVTDDDDGDYDIGIVDHGDVAHLADYEGWPNYQEYDDYMEAAPLTVFDERTGEESSLDNLGDSSEETDEESYALDYQSFL